MRDMSTKAGIETTSDYNKKVYPLIHDVYIV